MQFPDENYLTLSGIRCGADCSMAKPSLTMNQLTDIVECMTKALGKEGSAESDPSKVENVEWFSRFSILERIRISRTQMQRARRIKGLALKKGNRR